MWKLLEFFKETFIYDEYTCAILTQVLHKIHMLMCYSYRSCRAFYFTRWWNLHWKMFKHILYIQEVQESISLNILQKVLKWKVSGDFWQYILSKWGTKNLLKFVNFQTGITEGNGRGENFLWLWCRPHTPYINIHFKL